MTLQTDLSRSPYFDDYDSNKNFYRIMYRPSVAVQTRELNQMQTILQDQIDKFGRHIFKEGSVTEGCAFTFDSDYHYVKIADNFANGSAFTISDFQGKVVTNDNGLKALILNTIPGFESSTSGDLNTLYVKYLNSTTLPDQITPQNVFAPLDNLAISTTTSVAVGNVTVANSATTPTGKGYAFTTTSGVIFKKGFFINVKPQTLVVTKYDNQPDNISVGFDAVESIVTPEADPSLYDNAAGSPNYAAPGAHRLQLIPTLVTRTTSEITHTNSFFSLVDFKSGKPVSIKNDPQYAALGADTARRTYETNGNYVVYPFVLSTEPKANTDTNHSDYINLVSSRGLGYVEGYRVEFVNNNKVDLRRAKDYETLKNQIVSANFGYFVQVKEYAGEFNTDTLIQVELHNVAKSAVSTGNLCAGTGYSGTTKIGTAYLRGFTYSDGTIGTGKENYNAYLFDVQMSPGKNFADVKSMISRPASTILGVADVVLTYDATTNSSFAKIQQAKFNNMIFPFGQKAIKLDGFNNTGFVYRNKANSSFSTLATGSMTIALPATVGTASETYNQIGTLVGSETKNFIVVPSADGATTAKSGAIDVSGNVVTQNSSHTTAFLSEFMVGDYIYVNSEKRQITFIANNTYMTTATAFSAPATNQGYSKIFPAGVPLDFSKSNGVINRSIVVGSTSAQFNLGETLSASFNAFAYFDVLRGSTLPIKKNIKKGVHVTINCASHSATTKGPWSLGFPDVLKINNIWVNDGVYANSGADFTKSFKFDNGQRDGYYDLASISSPKTYLTANSRIVVSLDVFTYDQSQGVGFFTANSYPIDDVNLSNTNAITTQLIPQYTATDGSVFDLRDSVDYRPFAHNTATSSANSTNWSTTATANPSGVLTFDVLPSGTYLPAVDSNFQSDIQHYYGRKDRVVIRTNGELSILEGVPSNNPASPLEQNGTMTLGIVDVPPYPSLSTAEATDSGRYDYAVTSTITQNKRYTMKDINTLSNKIDNLEYYTSLSLLEKSAKDTLVRSGTTGQNRFQNGILVDPFAGHDIGNTLDPAYNISIDPNKTELRPLFTQFQKPMQFRQDLSTNVIRKGNGVFLNYTDQQYINQPYASKYRNCIEGNIYVWKGEINFDPPGDTSPDLYKNPDVVTNIDLASNFVNIAAAYGTQWGNWNTTDVTASTATNPKTLAASTTDGYGNITNQYNTQVVSTTQTTQQRVGKQMNVTTATNNYNLGTFVTDVSTLPYVRSINVRVTAHGLKPNTRVYAFMNNKDVNAWFRQSDSTFATVKAYGQPIISDSTGSVYGHFLIPPNTFKATSLEMILTDTSNLVTGADAETTKASGTFYGSNLSVGKGSSILSAREAVLSTKEVTESKKIVDVQVVNIPSTEFIPGPAPANDWSPGGSGDGGGGGGGDGGGGGGGGGCDCGDGGDGGDCGG